MNFAANLFGLVLLFAGSTARVHSKQILRFEISTGDAQLQQRFQLDFGCEGARSKYLQTKSCLCCLPAADEAGGFSEPEMTDHGYNTRR